MARIVCSMCIATLAAALSGTLVQAGGWGVITLQNVPAYLAADRPATFVYTMRQHGHRPVNGLDGRVEARKGSLVIRAKSHRLPTDGTYDATLTFPEPGRWTLDVISGALLHGHTLTIELDVIGRDAVPPPISEAEQGRRLFEGKGCVMCHAHAAFPDRRPVEFVNLSVKRYTPERVKAFLSALPARQADVSSYGTMPNLGLVEDEIDSLAAFLGR